MSDRTDLFKALNNFMAVLAAYAPGSHREDVVLEVGDAAFRAFERALDDKYMSERRLVPEKPSGPCVIEWHGESGRVVIRKRPEAKPETLACAWCRRRPSVTGFSRHNEESPICAECVPAASRGKPVLGNPPKWVTEEASAPEETKPPARAHLKGCALDTDHGGFCYGPSPMSAPEILNHGPMAPSDHAPDCRAVHAVSESCTEANVPSRPALSPRQALGEALACVERLKTLMHVAGLDDYGFCHEEGMTLGGAARHISGVIRGVRHREGLEEAAK